MKLIGKMILAVLAFGFLLLLGEWAGGGGKDRWDNLMKWARRGRKS